ncbi:hypothetical protein [Herpetosiphon geysericola]|uniref:Uncharacterized protein n=1 Tax=Herpetosiphon geysericola TaxID=70996 RepID=A0A0P6YUT2_9CHLR|nr:hypothetical protein [Herpetosiphon geysericola]KPL87555.1 hypothetical protein SE18_10860 [Herpetosiphon geysericola]
MSHRRVTVNSHTRVMPLKTFAIVCRWCGQTATVETYPGRKPTLCSAECAIEARKDHDRRRKAAKKAGQPAPRAAAVVAPIELPTRFVLWPSQVDRTLDRSLMGPFGTGLLGTLKTKADGRQILAILDALLIELWAVTVRWLVLDCVRREPEALTARLAVALTPDPLRKDVQWQREVTDLCSQMQGQGRLNAAQRAQLRSVGATVSNDFVGRQMRGLGEEEALDATQRAVAERELAVALIQLEAVMRTDGDLLRA